MQESSRRHVSSSQATNAPGSTSFLILDHLESIQEWQCLDLEEAGEKLDLLEIAKIDKIELLKTAIVQERLLPFS